MSFKVPEVFRLRAQGNRMASDSSYGNNGAFIFPNGMRCIASDGDGWEHVSASFPDRVPTWEEMCWVKDIFWEPEDCVVQYHPPASAYINHHPHTLHLWRPIGVVFPQPPSYMVGPKSN